VKLLLDDQATRGNILSELGDRWCQNAAPDDLVLIYFSSHGSSSDMDVGGVITFSPTTANPTNYSPPDWRCKI